MFPKPKIVIFGSCDTLVQNCLSREGNIELISHQEPPLSLSFLEEEPVALVFICCGEDSNASLAWIRTLKGIKKVKHIPIICYTEKHLYSEAILDLYDAGAVDFFFPPIHPDIFQSKISVFFDLYHQKQINEYQREQQELIIQEKEALNLLLESSNERLKEKKHKLEILASLDGLTGIANRRMFDEFLMREWQRCRRNNEPLSLVLLDIDHFKLFNDAYGHLQGDACLIQIAKTLQKIARRTTDLAARYGGEEFALILSNTDIKEALNLANKFQEILQPLQIIHPASPVSQFVTVSMGVTSLTPQSEDLNAFIDLADQAMYKAKENGRNQIMHVSVPQMGDSLAQLDFS